MNPPRNRYARLLSAATAVMLLAAALLNLPLRAASPQPRDKPSPGVLPVAVPTGGAPIVKTTATVADPKEPGSGSRYVSRGEVVRQLLAAQPGWPQTYSGQQVFADVPERSAVYHAINVAHSLGVVDGYPCGEVGPCLADERPYFLYGRATTRGEFAELVVRAARWPLTDNCPAATFSDVACGTRTHRYVETAYARGLVSGYPDGTFRPNDPIARTDLRFPPPIEAPAQVTRETKQRSAAQAATADAAWVPPDNRFGFDMVSVLYDTVYLNGNPVSDEHAMKMARASIVRYRLPWKDIQPDGPWQARFADSGADAVLSRLAAQGLNVLLELGSVPDWACLYPNYGTNTCENSDPSRRSFDVIAPWAYADFYNIAKSAVNRYTQNGYTVKMVEVINEPDDPNRWGPYRGDYVMLLIGTYNSIRSINATIPVMMGGLGYIPAWNSSTFLSGIMRDARSYTDAINFHHYDWNYAYPWGTWGWNSSTRQNNLGVLVDEIRAIDASNRPAGVGAKPLILSETGTNAHTQSCPNPDGTYVTLNSEPAKQASYVARLFARAVMKDIRSTMWFPFHDWATYDPDFCPYYDTGVIEEAGNNNTKAAYHVYRQAATQLAYPTSHIGALAATNLRGDYTKSEGYSFNRQFPNDRFHGMLWAWANLPGNNSSKLGFAKSITFDLWFFSQYGDYLCGVPNGDCPSSADNSQWYWALGDSGAAIFTFMPNPYYP